MTLVSVFNMDTENINLISVAKAFLKITKSEFGHHDREADPTPKEVLIAEEIFVKFAKITTNYTFIDEFENDFG